MNITHQIKALRDLHSAVNLSNRIESLQLYVIASVITKDLDSEIENLPSEEESEYTSYILEKLALFISYFNYAVMPTDSSHMTPEQRLSSAGNNLTKVEMYKAK